MKKVQESVLDFSLEENFKSVLMNLMESFNNIHEKFNVPFTVKMHIILVHLEQFIDLTGKL